MRIKRPFPRSTYVRNAAIYKILASPKRLEILNLLREQEMSVRELAKTLGASSINTSQHLALLRHAGLVAVRRNGPNAYYNIADPRIVKLCRILYRLLLARRR